ncbi:MAG: bifunctional nuclease family protein [Acidobacteriota bacterium]|jgi:bifunctional DNase/RNase
MLVELRIGALIMDPNSNSPIVVLRGVDSEAVLPIWVGAFEANAIAMEIEKIVPQRPMTHDLLRNIVTELGITVSRVVITELRDNTFYATVDMRDEAGRLITLDARPSDAIALALRADCAIFAEQDVIDTSTTTGKSPLADEDAERAPDEWPEVIG